VRDSPILAAAGALAIAMGYSLVLALEFLASRWAARNDPALRPTWAESARAWLGSTVAGPRVFCWRQPFRWRAIPDLLQSNLPSSSAGPSRRGVVFLHGFVCNRGFWNPWLARLRALEHPFIAVNLEPVFGSIDDYVPAVDAAVERMRQATGMPPVLVCHSMGGLVARAWLRATRGDDRVHHIITIGSPHQGTLLGRLSQVKNARQMHSGSVWLRDLARDRDAGRRALFTCWYSNCDNVVFPASLAMLEGADNRLVRGIGHVGLAFHPDVVDGSLAKIASK
jgi:triacylglycerol esterase/lipase EstA (alpha/beta hydrolase family)